MAAQPPTHAEPWEEILQGSNKDAFQDVVEPYMDVLLEAARRDLKFYIRNGSLHEGDFSPEELVGEGLIHAWKHREVRPPDMPLRSWLLGTQHRVTRGLVGRFRAYRKDKALSLDEPVELNSAGDDAQEWFWDWYQPDHELTWDEILPSGEEGDVEREPNDALEPADTEKRHVLVLHDDFEMSLPEVSFTMNRSPDAVSELLKQARTTVRERHDSDESEGPDHFTSTDPGRPEE